MLAPSGCAWYFALDVTRRETSNSPCPVQEELAMDMYEELERLKRSRNDITKEIERIRRCCDKSAPNWQPLPLSLPPLR